MSFRVRPVGGAHRTNVSAQSELQQTIMKLTNGFLRTTVFISCGFALLSASLFFLHEMNDSSVNSADNANARPSIAVEGRSSVEEGTQINCSMASENAAWKNFANPWGNRHSSCEIKVAGQRQTLDSIDDASSENDTKTVAVAERLAPILVQMRKGDFSIANDYLSATQNCRLIAENAPPHVARIEGCSEAEMAGIEHEAEMLLTMAANQQNVEAEIALARLWFFKAEAALNTSLAVISARERSASAEERAGNAVRTTAYANAMETMMGVLNRASAHNRDALAMLETLDNAHRNGHFLHLATKELQTPSKK